KRAAGLPVPQGAPGEARLPGLIFSAFSCGKGGKILPAASYLTLSYGASDQTRVCPCRQTGGGGRCVETESRTNACQSRSRSDERMLCRSHAREFRAVLRPCGRRDFRRQSRHHRNLGAEKSIHPRIAAESPPPRPRVRRDASGW